MLTPMQATAPAGEFSERLTWKRVGFWRRFGAFVIDALVPMMMKCASPGC